jgi:RNA polymerase sigma-70 factor, ECF subfamily
MPSLIPAPGPAGDASAPGSFEEAYRAYGARVARWAARLGGSEVDPEDIVQETFLVVSRKWSTVRDDGNFVSWLFQITRKIVANHRRRLRWRRMWSGQQDVASVRFEGPDPDAQLERRRLVALFHRAVERLPEKQRTVFVLYELEGMSTAAIAELTQRNLSTVKVQLSRARDAFVAAYQRLLRREGGHEETDLARLAERVVNAGAKSASRLGKKTS